MIAEIEERSSEVGNWLTIRHLESPILQALVHNDRGRADSGVTLFWPANSRPDAFVKFFLAGNLQTADHRPFELVEIRVTGYRRDTGEAQDLSAALLAAPYGDLSFLRLEQIATGSGREARPVLIVWCDLTDPELRPANAESAGVLFQPRHLHGLAPGLASLIVRSARAVFALNDVQVMLRALEQYLHPDATPVAMTA